MSIFIPNYHKALHFGHFLAQLRELTGRSQNQLAKEIGAERTNISKWENGHHAPSFAYLARLATFVDQVLSAAEPLASHRNALFQQIKIALQDKYEIPVRGWDDIVQLVEHYRPRKQKTQWGAAPDTTLFFGREIEQATLEQWVLEARCRLVAVLGSGGIGKTMLVTQVAHRIESHFDVVVWYSLRSAPPLMEFLKACLPLLSDTKHAVLSDDLQPLLHALQKRRCLLVLDNLEALLNPERAGQYRLEFAGYAALLRLLGESVHQSAVIITSRVQPVDVARMVAPYGAVRSLVLKGIEATVVRSFLHHTTLTGTEQSWQQLWAYSSGNPQILTLLSVHIQAIAFGRLDDFFRTHPALPGDVFSLLDEQFQQLPDAEQQMLYRLVFAGEPQTLQMLTDEREIAPFGETPGDVLMRLVHRHLVERSAEGVSLQNVIFEYLTRQLVRRLVIEVSTGKPKLFNLHPLCHARQKLYLQETVRRLIIRPLLERLQAELAYTSLFQRLSDMLPRFQTLPAARVGYGAANALTLLLEAKLAVRGLDFSGLPMWGMSLQNATLHDVNFTGADLTGSQFATAFDRIRTLALSPDGSRLAVGTTTGQLMVWRTADDQLIRICQAHDDWIREVVFNEGGDLLATASDDGAVAVWDGLTVQRLQTWTAHEGRVLALTFTTSRELISSGQDMLLRRWQVQTGACLATYSGHSRWVWGVVHPRGRDYVVSSSGDHSLRYWGLADATCRRILAQHSSYVWTLAASADGNLIASGSHDGTVRIWESASGLCLHTLPDHTRGVRTVHFTPDNAYLLAGDLIGTLYIWDVDSGSLVRAIVAHDVGDTWALEVSADGRVAITGGDDRTLRFWEIPSGRAVKTLQGYTGRVASVACDPDGDVMAAVVGEYTIQLWDVATGTAMAHRLHHGSVIRALVFADAGRTIAFADEAGQVHLWQIGQSEPYLTLSDHTSSLYTLVWHSERRLLASVGLDWKVCVWDTTSGDCIRRLTDNKDALYAVAFSLDGSQVAAAGEDKHIWCWHWESGQMLPPLAGHTSAIWGLACHPIRPWLASGSSDTTIRVWDLEHNECFAILGDHEGSVKAVAFSPSGKWLASASYDHTIRVWDTTTFACIMVLKGHQRPVWSVTFTPDEKHLISGSEDETIRLWSVPEGKPLLTVRAPLPYEGMNIRTVSGLTMTQRISLKALGARDA